MMKQIKYIMNLFRAEAKDNPRKFWIKVANLIYPKKIILNKLRKLE